MGRKLYCAEPESWRKSGIHTEQYPAQVNIKGGTCRLENSILSHVTRSFKHYPDRNPQLLSSTMLYFTFLLIYFPLVSSMYNPECRAIVVARLGNGTIQANDSTIFDKNNKGIFESDPNDRITLTLDGCWDECGTGWSRYAVWDIVDSQCGFFQSCSWLAICTSLRFVRYIVS